MVLYCKVIVQGMNFHSLNKGITYRNLPIKGAPHNKGAPHSLEEDNIVKNNQNDRSFLNNCPIFNPKPALES